MRLLWDFLGAPALPAWIALETLRNPKFINCSPNEHRSCPHWGFGVTAVPTDLGLDIPGWLWLQKSLEGWNKTIPVSPTASNTKSNLPQEIPCPDPCPARGDGHRLLLCWSEQQDLTSPCSQVAVWTAGPPHLEGLSPSLREFQDGLDWKISSSATPLPQLPLFPGFSKPIQALDRSAQSSPSFPSLLWDPETKFPP